MAYVAAAAAVCICVCGKLIANAAGCGDTQWREGAATTLCRWEFQRLMNESTYTYVINLQPSHGLDRTIKSRDDRWSSQFIVDNLAVRIYQRAVFRSKIRTRLKHNWMDPRSKMWKKQVKNDANATDDDRKVKN